uniref:Uncharacterized protein n=1 Tax=Arion vulgaris TaxID=1028688 RepID=A0A0B7BBU4_9EUPU
MMGNVVNIIPAFCTSQCISGTQLGQPENHYGQTKLHPTVELNLDYAPKKQVH